MFLDWVSNQQSFSASDYAQPSPLAMATLIFLKLVYILFLLNFYQHLMELELSKKCRKQLGLGYWLFYFFRSTKFITKFGRTKYFNKNPYKHGKREEQGRKKGPHRKSPISKVSSQEVEDWARSEDCLSSWPSGASSSPLSSTGVLEMLLKAVEMQETLLMWISCREHCSGLHTSIITGPSPLIQGPLHTQHVFLAPLSPTAVCVQPLADLPTTCLASLELSTFKFSI